MSVRDVMATDYQHLMAILGAEDEKVGEQVEVMNLGDFVNGL